MPMLCLDCCRMCAEISNSPLQGLYALSTALGVGHFRLTSFSSCLRVGAPHRRENLAMWTSPYSIKKQLTQAQVPQCRLLGRPLSISNEPAWLFHYSPSPSRP